MDVVKRVKGKIIPVNSKSGGQDRKQPETDITKDAMALTTAKKEEIRLPQKVKEDKTQVSEDNVDIFSREPEFETDSYLQDIDLLPVEDDALLLDDVDDLLDSSEDGEENPLLVVDTARLPSPRGARDSLNLYLREVSNFPMLTPEQEHELAIKVRDNNDPDAAFQLVSSHLRLVVRIAMDFQRRWMQNVLDLIQEGNVGLLKAVNRFDPEKGIKFSYYASFWIKAYILKFIMDNWRMVKIGTTQVQRKLFYNLNRERQKLIAQGFDPDAGMLSEKLGVSEDQINEMEQRLASTDVSLNVQVGDESGSSSKIDFLPALEPGVEECLASMEISDVIQEKIKTIIPRLNEKEKYILQHRLLADEPVTLREIGERYNITRERVRQLEARLLEKIRKHFTDGIKDFSHEWIVET